MDPEAEEERVAIAIVRRGDHFLVGVRLPGQALEGYAEFPGGKCEPGEPFEACVIRECREETGLEVSIRALRGEFLHAYPHGRLRLAFFDCEADLGSQPRPPFRWVSRAELAGLQFPEGNDAVIAELVGEINERGTADRPPLED